MGKCVNEIPAPVMEAIREHLFGELVSYSDRAGVVACDMGVGGVYSFGHRFVFGGFTVTYNVNVGLYDITWDSDITCMLGGIRYVSAVNYCVSIDGISVTGEDGTWYDVPDGVAGFLREGLSGLWNDCQTN